MLDLHHEILLSSDATEIIASESVQTLWSGYGVIRRYFLSGGVQTSVIVKHIQLSKALNHPRGWNTNLSHQRKVKSYEVERCWYKKYAHQTTEDCKVPQLLHVTDTDGELLLIMEDLNASGYHLRHDQVTIDQIKSCLKWLASFHAQFIDIKPEGLWPIGTYWHLDTRPDEWERMENQSLKKAAKAIDEKLNQARFQTIVHGDAKLANFCFNKDNGVAAVDFQYVGRGCGMKDVAYFISSCFDEAECEQYEAELINYYFKILEEKWDSNVDIQLVKEEWSNLYKYAWADFYRFLDGWSPGHWKMHDYSKKLTRQVLKELI